MELAEKYMELWNRIVEVHDGIYHLQMEEYSTDEDAHHVMVEWERQFGDTRILVITRDATQLHYYDQFDFPLAMQLIRSGMKVGRQNENFHLYLDPVEKVIMEQVIQEGFEPTVYAIDEEDLRAYDWYIVRDEEVR
jgi:hypothetical protein